MAQGTASHNVFQIPQLTQEAVNAQFAAITSPDAMSQISLTSEAVDAQFAALTGQPDPVERARMRVEQANSEAAATHAQGLDLPPHMRDRIVLNDAYPANGWLTDEARSEARDASTVLVGERAPRLEGYTSPQQIYQVGQMIDFARKQVNSMPPAYSQAIGHSNGHAS